MAPAVILSIFSCFLPSSFIKRTNARCSISQISNLLWVRMAFTIASARATRFICQGLAMPPTASDILIYENGRRLGQGAKSGQRAAGYGYRVYRHRFPHQTG